MQLVLGQLSTDEKSNEITAIPRLLDIFCVRGNTITIDAIGTRREIAQKIVEKGGDYVLALKENQPTLLDDIRFYMENEVFTRKKSTLKAGGQYARTCENDHGRIETRECFVIPDLSWLDGRERWAGLRGAGLVRSIRKSADCHASVSDRYVIFSRKDMNAAELLKIKRGHWAIENQPHWQLDMLFHEDNSSARVENAAEILNMLRKLALQLMKQDKSLKASVRAKRLRCGYDFFYALHLLGLSSVS
jgi:predicted transposase YbfD/YdcC